MTSQAGHGPAAPATDLPRDCPLTHRVLALASTTTPLLTVLYFASGSVGAALQLWNLAPFWNKPQWHMNSCSAPWVLFQQ